MLKKPMAAASRKASLDIVSNLVQMKLIDNNVVRGGPELALPSHLSLGLYVLEKLRRDNVSGNTAALIDGNTNSKLIGKEILQEIVNVASGLQRMGVKQGDVVALCSENSAEFISATMGTVCCGATLTTVNVLYTEDEFTHVLDISRPATIYCSKVALERFHSVIKSLPYIKNVIQLNGKPVSSGVIPYSDAMLETDAHQYEPAAVQGGVDTAFILYSSGTTGLPKGVMLTHVNVLYIIASLDTGYTRKTCSRFLTTSPWYHVYGLITTIHYLTCDKELVYFTRFNPETYIKSIADYKIHALIAVPPIVIHLAKSSFLNDYDVSSVKVIWCGGAPLSAETTSSVLKRMPNCKRIIQAYGMTEVTLSAMKDYDNDDSTEKPGSCGYPIPGVDAKVVDVSTRVKQKAHQEGEICLKGPIVMKGYMNNEAATRDMIDEEGYLKTGDIGYYDDEGCFFIIDRLKELIKYKGFQVSPAAVERVVLQHAGVAECGVVGAPDELAGELPTAFVVAKPGAALTEPDLLRFTDERLSHVARLRGGIIFVNTIPKNGSGKILRRELKQCFYNK